MRFRQSFLLFFCIFLASNTYSQLYNFKVYSYEQGLPESGIHTLYEDARGNLWIGTASEGLIRFDGNNFYSYTVAEGWDDIPMNAIAEDPSGNLLIGTDSGAFAYDGKYFRLLNQFTGLAVSSVLRDRSGMMWIGTKTNGLYTYDGTTVEKISAGSDATVNSVRSLYLDSEDRIWIGTSDGIVMRNGQGNFEFFTKQAFAHVHDMEEDADGNMWIATDKGVFKFEENAFVNVKAGYAHAIGRDIRNDVWFSSTSGIFRYNGKAFQLHQLTSRQENIINTIYRDLLGNLWFGMSQGLAKLESERFIRYPENSHAGKQVYSMVQSINGNIMCGTSLGGMTILDGQQFSLLDERENFTSSIVQSFFYSPDSALWIGTQDDGIFRFSKSGFNHYSRDEGFRFSNISGFTVDQHQNIWVASADSGVAVIQAFGDSLSVARKYNRANGLPADQITSIVNDGAGNIWLGTSTSGIVRMTTAGDSVTITTLSTKNGLTSDVVYTIITDSLHRLYIGTSRGIVFYNGTTFQSLTKSNGLGSNTIYSLALDHQRNLWAGTEKGVDRVSIAENFGQSAIEHFGMAEGFEGMEVYRNSTCVDREGNIWFGTINGLIKYDRGYDSQTNNAPKTYITGLKLFFDKIEDTLYGDSLTSWYPMPHELELPYNQNNLTFSFAGIYLRNPKAVRYKWMLVGFSPEWSPVLKEQEAVFSNLPPGDYTFKVMSGNENNVWSEPASFGFSIIPPLWQRWWVKALGIAVFVFVTWMIFYLRLRNIKARNKVAQEKLEMEKSILELEQEAARLQMNPHFIFNCLNSIQGFISVNDAVQAKKYLAKFARLMRLILENAREEFIPLENEINILESYMELEKLSTNPKFEFSIMVDESIDAEHLQIPPMMIQPFVENAIIHGIRRKSTPGFISIHFKTEGEMLNCTVRDNGIGRKKAAEINAQAKSLHKSTAISITQKRLQQYSQHREVAAGIEIIDLEENNNSTGTQVTVLTPFETF